MELAIEHDTDATHALDEHGLRGGRLRR
jgi:hypothetical protein